ncbi:class I SAM-dependent methyltransferase [Phytohabitans sp. ZYX-F-186]|uniref:Class I SAM-dependent methyltransferase n=1 Tax=Phytohabitans maris TaxID=3071409 RepID=A0ABU0ZK60_9ACTN|nr:class I SAM-dependent methyltransferase [Phytohabitans sp. ZYX-F-186]MDQ7907420.1 class I SAM-dependent methyltransferase [Phytohabitans sp. ZYX-F-186]
MRDIIRRVDRCRVCGNDDWLEVMSLGSTPLANGFLDPAPAYPDEPVYPVDVIACRRCWLMSLRHVVDPQVLFTHYVYLTSESDQMAQHMRRIVEWSTRKLGLTAGDLVVELGSNIGTQLEIFAAAGLRTVGVDPARNLARIANDRGVETVADFFGPHVAGPIAQKHGRAKLVLGRQCFAHIDDVHHVLDGVDAVLAPDGALAIEVPYLVDLLDQNQFDTIYHEHLSYYSLGTLGRLFESHGLRLVDVERADVHGGSIVAFASRPTVRPPAPSVSRLLALEEERGLSTGRPYQDLADRTRKVVDNVGGLVRDLVASGKRVAGYGAPSKGHALLQACGLDRKEIEFVTDTTPLKQGKVWAGNLIPVFTPEQARSRPPDYYLLLAWNYSSEVIRKEHEFLAQGGRFIVPIPQPRIVAEPEPARRYA